MEEIKQIKHSIEFLADTPIKMGNVFYAVERAYDEHFYGKCAVCNGEKTITINGYKFTCPNCRGLGEQAIVLSVPTYKVYRYRVQETSEQLIMSCWKQNNGFTKRITITLYRPRPIGSFNEYEKTIKLYSDNNKYIKLPNNVFYEYKKACAEADRLNAEQEDKVLKYNSDNSTNFVFEKPKYDLKSN